MDQEQQEQSRTIWGVVLVESGIPSLVEAFCDEQPAMARALALQECMNPEDDEVGVFQVQVLTT